MTSETLYEVLGDINEEYIIKARTTRRKFQKPAWIKWGAMAACLAMVCVIVASFILPNHEDEAAPPRVADLAPMVYVNDTLYIQSGTQQGYPEKKEEFVFLGKIKSTVSEQGTPKENFQANDCIVGCEVYQYGENIVVYVNGAYWLYTEYLQ